MNQQTNSSIPATPRGSTATACADHGPNVDHSTEAAEQLIGQAKVAALSSNTRNTNRTGWSSWARWATARGFSTFPAAPDHLQGWLATLCLEGKKPTTLRIYLAAVDHEHRDCVGHNPAQHPEVRRLMSGIDRQAAADGYQPNQAKPLRRHHIQQVIRHTETRLAQVNMQPQQRQRLLADIAMITLAHDALLRCGELLALRWGDVSHSDEAETGRVLIRRSKTDQTGQGAVCPVSAGTLRALERMRSPNAQPHHRIFPISASTLRRRIKAVAQAAGINPAGITTHSPRIGMAQDLAAAGADMATLMIAGRWKQPATVARYIRNLSADHTPVAQYLKTQDSTPQKPSTPEPPANSPSPLHAPTAQPHPTTHNTARKAMSLASYSIRSLVKEFAAQLATFSPGMGDRVGQVRSRTDRLASVDHVSQIGPVGHHSDIGSRVTVHHQDVSGHARARVPTSPSMRRAMA